MRAILILSAAFAFGCEQCPHDGKHGDYMSVTVRHNGKKKTCEVATAYILGPRDAASEACEMFKLTADRHDTR